MTSCKMDSLISRSISIILAVGLGYELATCNSPLAEAEPLSAHSANVNVGRWVDKCCQIGRDKAIESPKFNCKLGAREALINLSQAGERTSQLLALSVDSLLARDPNFGDQCEMVLESCCLAHHRIRNCNSGKQFAKSGSACMDVELSKEATLATESFNDCCMSCSLGILAARNPGQNDTAGRVASSLNDRCKLISPLASSLSGQLYEQTYNECCQENLPKLSSALVFDSGAPIDCSQAANVCSQRCLASGSLDPVTRRPIEQDRCDCFSGFKLAGDGISCIDIDECKLSLHTCDRSSEVCDNTRGSFRCLARSHQQQGRALALDDKSADQAIFIGEQPFASFRLCAPGFRWLSAESRCVSSSSSSSSSSDNFAGGSNNHHHQQHWKRNAAYSSTSSSSSSSRRSTRTD